MSSDRKTNCRYTPHSNDRNQARVRHTWGIVQPRQFHYTQSSAVLGHFSYLYSLHPRVADAVMCDVQSVANSVVAGSEFVIGASPVSVRISTPRSTAPLRRGRIGPAGLPIIYRVMTHRTSCRRGPWPKKSLRCDAKRCKQEAGRLETAQAGRSKIEIYPKYRILRYYPKCQCNTGPFRVVRFGGK